MLNQTSKLMAARKSSSDHHTSSIHCAISLSTLHILYVQKKKRERSKSSTVTGKVSKKKKDLWHKLYKKIKKMKIEERRKKK